jgi:signal transduction histidine kinase
VITHVLQNAQRHRRAGTPITLRLRADEARATVELHNVGDAIPGELIDKVFEYGVSGAEEIDGAAPYDAQRQAPQRGQGLFVAKTYMAKMGGTITADNVAGGVRVVLTLPRVAG